MKSGDYKAKIGELVAQTRLWRRMTQAELAEAVGTSQSAINRIESGNQNLSVDMIEKISQALKVELLSFNKKGTVHFKINGGRKLHGSIEIRGSKNAAVGLLCGCLINRGRTTLKNVPHIEEVNRIVEVLESIGVKTRWINEQHDLELTPPPRLKLGQMDIAAAKRTRSVLMMMGSIMNSYSQFKMPYAGGCNLGKRTVEPHLAGLREFGLEITTHDDFYHATVKPVNLKEKTIVLVERGDTVTENILFAAATKDMITHIHNASSNYMVQDICFYLQKLGVKIDGVGTTRLTVYGKSDINQDIEYKISEDPIEAMSFLAAGVVTDSEIEIKRMPIDFLEIEFEILRSMGLKFDQSAVYLARNGQTKLVDIKLRKSYLVAPLDKIHPMPYPGLNIDNLPFFAIIAAKANGRTLIHDWVYENRAIYLTELSKLNVRNQLLDPHRIYIEGATEFRPAEIVTPPALRPAVVIMLGMLAASGESILRNVYSINRGYEDFARRLNSLGADIELLY
ncbi:MAG: UDP-N-acetylglucosamine 1-carboxyvinyltransferase [Candidatus Saccharibacteria bacterium]|nr:UDP-N-acetylglucosamine 1-carboxyvinyltransferase [Candidatus Saccharibacteria bacterium]